MSFINRRRPTRSPLWIPTLVITSYTVPYGFRYGSPCKKFCPTLPHIGSHVIYINPRRPTRSPLWFPVWRIPSHTVPYGFLYGPTSRKFRPILLHMGSRVSFINPRRPIRSPLWFPVWGILSHTVPYGFLYGPPMQKISPDADTNGFLHGILLFPMPFHGFPCNPMLKPIWKFSIVTEGWRCERNPCLQVNCYSKRLFTGRAAHRE